MNTRRRISLLTCALGLLAAVAPAGAQGTYPDHPVKLIVALPAGGGVDLIARLVGQKLAAVTGQPFVVDNRAGASGRIGLPVVAKAALDGYTLMASPASFLTTNKSIFKEMPYDPQADFAPITKLANQSMVLVVKDKQKFSSAGVRMTHVPYKGGALAINDLLGGNVDLLFAPLPEALPYLKSGKLTALALMSDKRSALIADVPTMREAGIPNMVMQTWIPLLAPAGTPRPLVDQLNRQVHAILQSEDVKKQLHEMGMDLAPTPPEQLQQTTTQEIALHAELVKAAGLVPQ